MIFGGERRGPMNNRLDFGGDPYTGFLDPSPGSDHDPDPGIFKKGFFIYYCDSIDSAE